MDNRVVRGNRFVGDAGEVVKAPVETNWDGAPLLHIVRVSLSQAREARLEGSWTPACTSLVNALNGLLQAAKIAAQRQRDRRKAESGAVRDDEQVLHLPSAQIAHAWLTVPMLVAAGRMTEAEAQDAYLRAICGQFKRAAPPELDEKNLRAVRFMAEDPDARGRAGPKYTDIKCMQSHARELLRNHHEAQSNQEDFQ